MRSLCAGTTSRPPTDHQVSTSPIRHASITSRRAMLSCCYSADTRPTSEKMPRRAHRPESLRVGGLQKIKRNSVSLSNSPRRRPSRLSIKPFRDGLPGAKPHQATTASSARPRPIRMTGSHDPTDNGRLQSAVRVSARLLKASESRKALVTEIRDLSQKVPVVSQRTP